MSHTSLTAALDRGTLHLHLNIDVETLTVAALFVAVAAVEIAFMLSGGGSPLDSGALSFTT